MNVPFLAKPSFAVTPLRRSKTSFRLLFGLLLATDAAFISAHLLHSLTDAAFNDPQFNLGLDRGYGEIFQYVKEYWLIAVMGLLAFRRRSALYLVWAVLFGYLLLDDSMEIHETAGAHVQDMLPFDLSRGGQDLEEMIVSIVAGALFLLAGVAAYRFADKKARTASLYLLLLLGLLAFFGVVTDVLHGILVYGRPTISPVVDPLFIAVEDGGEMVVMSCMVLFVLLLASSYGEEMESEDLERP